MTVRHRDLTDPNLHEIKGASTALEGQIPTADGSGATSFAAPAKRQGIYVYHTITPQVISAVAGTFTQIVNSGAGTNTDISNALPGVTNVWDTSTNEFDFSALPFGSTIGITMDLSLTQDNPDSRVDCQLEFTDFGITGRREFPYYQLVGSESKTLPFERTFYLLDQAQVDSPAIISLKSSTEDLNIIGNTMYVKVILP